MLNIFSPKSPLHDGAVIIRGSRVTAASCVLPLTENNNGIFKELGTRHRTGIGISEVSDALAIIISEETGSISLAVEGLLTKELKESDLINRLTGVLQPKPANSLAPFWRRK